MLLHNSLGLDAVVRNVAIDGAERRRVGAERLEERTTSRSRTPEDEKHLSRPVEIVAISIDHVGSARNGWEDSWSQRRGGIVSAGSMVPRPATTAA